MYNFCFDVFNINILYLELKSVIIVKKCKYFVVLGMICLVFDKVLGVLYVFINY